MATTGKTKSGTTARKAPAKTTARSATSRAPAKTGATGAGAKAAGSKQTVKTVNLALQGGGAHGAFAWGVIDRLMEDGRIEVEGISATSAGAMNAAVMAHGWMQGGHDGVRAHLHSFWKKISEAGERFSPIRRTPLDDMMGMMGMRDAIAFSAFEAMTRLFSPYQFNPFNFNPLRDVLVDVVDFDALKKDRRTKLHICATNVHTGKVRVFKNAEMSPEAVLASACLPFLFQAVEIDGEAYWDGGYMGNPAIFPLIYDCDAKDVVVVHINPVYREEIPQTATDIMNRINEISFNSSLMREMRAINFVSDLIDNDWLKPEHKNKLKKMLIHSIRSDDVMGQLSVASKFENSWDFLTGLRDQGRKVADQWLKDHHGHLGKKTTTDMAEFM